MSYLGALGVSIISRVTEWCFNIKLQIIFHIELWIYAL